MICFLSGFLIQDSGFSIHNEHRENRLPVINLTYDPLKSMKNTSFGQSSASIFPAILMKPKANRKDARIFTKGNAMNII